MNESAHVFVGHFQDADDARAYSEAHWEPEPGEVPVTKTSLPGKKGTPAGRSSTIWRHTSTAISSRRSLAKLGTHTLASSW